MSLSPVEPVLNFYYGYATELWLSLHLFKVWLMINDYYTIRLSVLYYRSIYSFLKYVVKTENGSVDNVEK